MCSPSWFMCAFTCACLPLCVYLACLPVCSYLVCLPVYVYLCVYLACLPVHVYLCVFTLHVYLCVLTMHVYLHILPVRVYLCMFTCTLHSTQTSKGVKVYVTVCYTYTKMLRMPILWVNVPSMPRRASSILANQTLRNRCAAEMLECLLFMCKCVLQVQKIYCITASQTFTNPCDAENDVESGA